MMMREKNCLKSHLLNSDANQKLRQLGDRLRSSFVNIYLTMVAPRWKALREIEEKMLLPARGWCDVWKGEMLE